MPRLACEEEAQPVARANVRAGAWPWLIVDVRRKTMTKAKELSAARAKIQAELEGKTLLRVNYTALKKDDAAYLPHGIFFIAAGWYRDEPFHCRDCGKLEIWTAQQQKWWYEVAKGSVHQVATRCRSCRKAQKKKKEAHAARTRAGYEKKKRA